MSTATLAAPPPAAIEEAALTLPWTMRLDGNDGTGLSIIAICKECGWQGGLALTHDEVVENARWHHQMHEKDGGAPRGGGRSTRPASRRSKRAAARAARPSSTPCVDCGAPIPVAARGRIGRWCDDCKTRRHRAANEAYAERRRKGRTPRRAGAPKPEPVWSACPIIGCETLTLRGYCPHHAAVAQHATKRGIPMPADGVLPPRLCSIDGCEGEHVAKGLCGKHWYQSRAAATAQGRQPAPVRHCSIEGCEKRHLARGLCKLHYQQALRADAKAAA